LIITVDPDSVRSAIARAVWDPERDGYRYRGSAGGGSSKTPSPWQTIAGQLELIDSELEREGVEASEALVVVESQGANSKWSKDVEALRRVRYHFQAACELRKVACKFVTIVWALSFVPGAQRKGKDAQKKAYRVKAQELTRGETTNEDRCAAFGMLAVEVDALGYDLLID